MRIQVLRFVLVLLTVAMSASLVACISTRRREGVALRCHLIAKSEVVSPDQGALGILELRNESQELVVIQFQDDLTEHLVLEVYDPSGKLMPKIRPRYGDVYAGIRGFEAKPDTVTINSGETYRYQGDIVLFSQVGDYEPRPLTDLEKVLAGLGDDTIAVQHQLAPGKYTIRAVFLLNGKEFRSDAIVIEVREK